MPEPAVIRGPHVLHEYAFLGDGCRGALIGPHGDIGFLCAPAWDSPAVFATMLGGPGHFTVTPADPHHTWGGFYEPGSLIWTSRWVTGDGITHCREALAYPGEPDTAVLLRRIVAVDGEATVDITLDLRSGFGRHRISDVHRHRDATVTGRCGGLRWRLTAPFGLHLSDAGVLWTRLRLPAGEHADLLLELSSADLGPRRDPAATWTATERRWVAHSAAPAGLLADRDVTHGLAVLRGLTHPDGGLVAAATTSIPERAEQGRNYDYRYVWLRDQCIAGQAAAAVGATDLLEAAVRYVTARLGEHGPDTAPAYTVTGAPVPDERRVRGLRGYPGAPARVGNHARSQFQLDVFGHALLLYADAARLDALTGDGVAAVQIAAGTIRDRWRQPDAGIWELDPACWTSSRLTAVTGLRAAAAFIPAGQAAEFLSVAEAISEDLGRHYVHPTGRWRRARDDDRVDAALLLPAVLGPLDTNDPRHRATLAAIDTELTVDDHVYRYRPDRRPLGDAEGAFLLCGFTLAHAYQQIGDPIRAAQVFERNPAACGPAGLFAEEYDVTQRQLRGNLPQAFVHAMLIRTAAALAPS